MKHASSRYLARSPPWNTRKGRTEGKRKYIRHTRGIKTRGGKDGREENTIWLANVRNSEDEGKKDDGNTGMRNRREIQLQTLEQYYIAILPACPHRSK